MHETGAFETATLPCEDGYRGVLSRFCNAWGHWEAVVNNCDRIYCKPSYFTFKTQAGGIVASDSRSPKSPANAVLVLRCPLGYTKKTGNSDFNGDITVTCNANGVWGSVVGTCERILCSARKSKVWKYTDPAEPKDSFDLTRPEQTEDAGWVLWNKTPVGEYIEKDLPCGKAVRFCSLDKGQPRLLWTVKCGHGVKFCSGEKVDVDIVSESVWPPTQVDGKAVIDCKNGKFISRRCIVDKKDVNTGTWQEVEGTCSSQSCPSEVSNMVQPRILVDENDKARYFAALEWPKTTAGTIATTSCPVGFNTRDELTRECRIDGTWSKEMGGSCAVKYCPSYKAEVKSGMSVLWKKTPAGAAHTPVHVETHTQGHYFVNAA